ncbi:MAG: peptidoglycan-associated lipoprotein Pal [Desulfobacterales bacterium]|nr:peptidoglycan-associated lipoprotein Pal [Desulfobacterales bacterium]
MRKNGLKILMVLIAVSALMFTVSCMGKFAYDPSIKTSLSEEEARLVAEGGEAMFVNDDIFFAFDSSALSQEAKHTLLRKDYWMKNNTGPSVIIEGHCDERGTNEYNLALGERRALSAKNYLVNLGIDKSKLDTVSYGEERPVDSGSNEAAWQKNRRGHFVIK